MASGRARRVMEEKGSLMGRKGKGRQIKLNSEFKLHLSRPCTLGSFTNVTLLHHSEKSHYSN